jgi:hypothetical protein
VSGSNNRESYRSCQRFFAFGLWERPALSGPSSKSDTEIIDVMRMVRVFRAERIVITDGSLKIIRHIDAPIAKEPNQ